MSTPDPCSECNGYREHTYYPLCEDCAHKYTELFGQLLFKPCYASDDGVVIEWTSVVKFIKGMHYNILERTHEQKVWFTDEDLENLQPKKFNPWQNNGLS